MLNKSSKLDLLLQNTQCDLNLNHRETGEQKRKKTERIFPTKHDPVPVCVVLEFVSFLPASQSYMVQKLVMEVQNEPPFTLFEFCVP